MCAMNCEHGALLFERPCHFVASLGKPKIATPGHICLCTSGILSDLLYLSIRFGTCSDRNRRVQETLAALLPSVLNLWQGGKKASGAFSNTQQLLQICFDQSPHAVSAVPTQSHHQTLLLDLLTDLTQLERPTQHAAVPSTCLQQCYGKQHPPSQTCKSLPAAWLIGRLPSVVN